MANPLKDLSFQTLFDAVVDAMLLVDSAGHVIEANPAALELLEYTEEALLGLEVEALIPVSLRRYHRQDRDAFYKNPEKRPMGSGRDLFAFTRSGKEIAVDIGLSPIQAQEQAYILITFYPAEKRRKAEKALRASEERLRLAKQAASLGTFDYDPKNKGLYWDERMYELWGHTIDVPITYEKAIATIHPDDQEASLAALEHATDPAGNGEYKAEYRVIDPKGEIERWVSVVGQMHFKDGHATRLIGIVRDVTEHKILERVLQEHREETEDVFQQQVAIHTASAIAHELNQPLAAISAYSEVALHALDNPTTSSPEKLKRALEGCVAQAHRAGTSLHELLAFLQEGELVTEQFDLNAIVLEAINIAKSDGNKEFKLILHFDKHMPAVLANRIHVQKVLVNLLRNAVEAMRGAKVADTEIAVMVRTHKKINMAHVTVKDSGPGISQEMVKKIFDPFFTTKSIGIGMGLAISRALIESNNGQLWLEPSNTSGNTKPGATFHFTLPFAP